MGIVHRILLTIVSIAALACAQGLALAAPEPSDEDFLAAKAAFERGQRSRVRGAGAKARRACARGVRRILATVSAPRCWQAPTTFRRTSSNGGIRRSLIVCASIISRVLGRRADWAAFGAMYPSPAGEDVELACYGIQYRRLQEGRRRSRPPSCFGSPRRRRPNRASRYSPRSSQAANLSAADRRARFRLAAEAGNVRLARVIAEDLPLDSRIPTRDFMAVERDPARALAKDEFAVKTRGGRELLLYALERAARSDAAGVRARMGKAARAAARRRSPVRECADRLPRCTSAPPARQRLVPRSRGRAAQRCAACLARAGRIARGRVVRRRRGHCGDAGVAGAGAGLALLESARAGSEGSSCRSEGDLRGARRRVQFLRPARGGSARAANRARQRSSTPIGGRARAVRRATGDPPRGEAGASSTCGRNRSANGCTSFAGRDDDGLLLAADYARRAGLYDRAINTADRTKERHDFGLRYMMPFREHFAAAARDQAADEALLLSVARQESRFAPDIVSSAGAVGLMQLMPPTARWVAKQMGRSDYRSSQIAELAINTQFGAFYFKYWQDRLEGMPALAAAAYNAGPNRAQAWRNGAPLEGAIWVESIPFNETRDYVKKVLANAMFYARELDQPYVSLSISPGHGTTTQQRERRHRRRDRRQGAITMSKGSVLVLGGGGFIGRHVVNDLVRAGCDVVVPTRRRERARHLILLPTVDVVEGDIHDPATLASLMTDVSAVVNLVGILNESVRDTFARVHAELAKKIVAACRQSDVRRLVQMSALNADPNGPSAYLRSKGEAEAVVAASGLDWTIFRPSVVFGREDRFLNLFATLERYLPLMAIAAAETRFQPVFVGDVAHCFERALADNATIGQRFPLCGPGRVHTARARRLCRQADRTRAADLGARAEAGTATGALARARAGHADESRQPRVDASRQRLRRAHSLLFSASCRRRLRRSRRPISDRPRQRAATTHIGRRSGAERDSADEAQQSRWAAGENLSCRRLGPRRAPRAARG